MTAGIMGGIVKQTRGERSGFLCSNKDTPVPLLALYDELERGRSSAQTCPDILTSRWGVMMCPAG